MKFIFLLILTLCFGSATAQQPYVIAGSTPCSLFLKDKLKISSATPCDFMKWEIMMKEPDAFAAKISYGESKPNTNGFKDGHPTLQLTGTLTPATSRSGKPIYQLHFEHTGTTLFLWPASRFVFHFLDDANRPMASGEGFSYTLNRIK